MASQGKMSSMFTMAFNGRKKICIWDNIQIFLLAHISIYIYIYKKEKTTLFSLQKSVLLTTDVVEMLMQRLN